MAKAYTVTSDPFFVNGSVTETAENAFTQTQISLPLDSLNREGVLVHAVYFSGQEPERILDATSQVKLQVTSTSQTGIVGANNANLIASQQKTIVGGTAEYSALTLIDQIGSNLPYSMEDNLMIIATDDCFFGIQGVNQNNVKQAQMRMVCSRIRLSADAYAALVTNELSS